MQSIVRVNISVGVLDSKFARDYCSYEDLYTLVTHSILLSVLFEV